MNLDDYEYSEKAAAKTHERAAEQRHAAEQRRTVAAAPIADQAELSRAVARLAQSWGLKRKKGRRS